LVDDGAKEEMNLERGGHHRLGGDALEIPQYCYINSKITA